MWCNFKILNIYAVTCCPLSHLLNNNVLSVQNRILVTKIFVCVLDWSPSCAVLQSSPPLVCQAVHVKHWVRQQQTLRVVRVICRLVPVWLEAVPCSVSTVLLLLQFPSSGPSLPSAHCELSHICIMSWPTWPGLACLHLIYSIFDKIFTICIIQEYHSLNIKDTLHQNRS